MKIITVMAKYWKAFAAVAGLIVLLYVFGSIYYYRFPEHFELPVPERDTGLVHREQHERGECALPRPECVSLTENQPRHCRQRTSPSRP